MVAKLNNAVFFRGILALENVGAALSYCSIFLNIASS
jgi:hypothetical protein